MRKAQNGTVEAAELARAALAEARRNGLRAAAERLLAHALVLVGAVGSAHRHAAVALVTARTTGDPGSIAEGEATLAWAEFWSGGGVRIDLLAAARAPRSWSCLRTAGGHPGSITGILLSCRTRSPTPGMRWRPRTAGSPTWVRTGPAPGSCSRSPSWSAAPATWRARSGASRRGCASAGLVGDDCSRSLLSAVGRVAAYQGRLDAAWAAGTDAAALATRSGRQRAGVRPRAPGLLRAVGRRHGRRAPPPRADLRPPAPRRGLRPGVRAVRSRRGRGARRARPHGRRAAAARAVRLPGRRAGPTLGAGRSGRCRALLQAAAGELDGGAGGRRAALGAHDLVPLPFERARTLLVAGSLHRRLRRRREARGALDDALAEFTRLVRPSGQTRPGRSGAGSAAAWARRGS